MLLTIAGSSCSGKTTAAHACADVSRLVVHDFDEIGVPNAADVRWRQRGMESWLRRVLGYQDDGLDVLLTGQSPLGEVLASPSAVHLNGIAPCLLDVADDERLRRLEHRDPGRWQPDTAQSLIGWARWHRKHAADPRYRPDALTADGWERMLWARWCTWLPGDPRWAVTIIETTGQPVGQTALTIQHWIAQARADLASGRLALTQDWAAPSPPTDTIAAELNGRPRQALDFQTPSEALTKALRWPPELRGMSECQAAEQWSPRTTTSASRQLPMLGAVALPRQLSGWSA